MLSVDDIQSMRRNELQALAKQHGIRANQKSTVLMEQLCKIIGNDDAKSATTAPVAPEDKTDNQNTISPQTLDKDYVTSATRKELQALCKQNGIRANQKSAVLREELLKQCVPADTKCDDAVDDSAEPCDNVAQDEQEIDAAGDVSEGINANNVATSTPAEATKPTPDADNSHNNSAEVAETAQPNATSTLSQNEDPATASQKPPMTSDMAKIVLTSMLSSHAPEKLANVDKLLAKHVGKEDELLQKVAAKYGIGLKKAGTDEDKAQPNKSVAAVRRAGRTPIKRPVTRPSRIKNAGRALNKPKPKAHTPRAATVARPTVPTIRGGGEVVRRRLSAHIKGQRKSVFSAKKRARPTKRPLADSTKDNTALSRTGRKRTSSKQAATCTMLSQKKRPRKKAIDWDAIHRRDEARNLRNTETLWERQARLQKERLKL